MKTLLIRFLLLLIVIFFQLSFLDILFPQLAVPIGIVVCTVVWTLVQGFPRALWMTVPLSVLYEIVVSGSVGIFSVFSIVLAYGVSFLSRRLLIEERGNGIFLYAVVAAGAALVCRIFLIAFLAGDTGVYVFRTGGFSSLFVGIPIMRIVVISSVLFIVAYPLMRRFENYIVRISQQQFLNVR